MEVATNPHLDFKVVVINGGQREDYTYGGPMPTRLNLIRNIARSLVTDGTAESTEVMVNCGVGWETLNTYLRD